MTKKRSKLPFGKAFEMVKAKKGLNTGMRLPHWEDDVMIFAQYPDEHSKMAAPYLYVFSFGNDLVVRSVPWIPTMIELFSEDWEVVV